MKPVPKPITAPTGEEERFAKIIDDFFDETEEVFKKQYKIRRPGFERKSGEIAYRPEAVTNDRVTYLSYRENVLAFVLAIRTEFNDVHYTFIRNLDFKKKK